MIHKFSVSPKIPKIFAKKAMTLLEDQELYKEFSTAAVGTASKFSDMNSAKNLLKIYEAQIKRSYNSNK